MLPATIGLSATQINIFVNTNFAACCAEGSVSWLNYAFRLVQLPIGVFGVALSIAIMPVLARQAAVKDMASLKQTFVSSLVLVFALAVPATAGLALLSSRSSGSSSSTGPSPPPTPSRPPRPCPITPSACLPTRPSR